MAFGISRRPGNVEILPGATGQIVSDHILLTSWRVGEGFD